MPKINLSQGIHSLTIKGNKVVVETRIGNQSMVSTFTLAEYDKALNCYNKLING